jgi:DNA-directed RNA polymerase specialized sigma24 family protein
MSSAGASVTTWLQLLRVGDAVAAQHLFERYIDQLTRLAHRKLHGASRRVVDEKDVAQSAFWSFCQAVRRGRFPKLANRDDLWQILVMLTARKAVNQRKHELRLKRGGGKVRGDSAFIGARGSSDEGCIDEIIGHVPTPEFVAMMAEECDRLFGLLHLDDAEETALLRTVAQLKMEGYDKEEIAQQIQRSTRTVERKLKRIQSLWRQEMES